MTFISVVIPTRDRPESVLTAVSSILSGTHQDVEVIVVDQSSDDTTASLLDAVDDERLHHLLNRRPGFGAASSRNLGLAYARGDLLAVTDDDVAAHPAWLRRIAEAFAADPHLDFIAGRLAAPDYDHTAGFVPEFDADPNLPLHRTALHVSGANFSMRPRVLQVVGGYDEFCGPGSRLRASDDTDFCHRVIRAGLNIALRPDIEVVHVNGFRDLAQTEALSVRYTYGNGGNYGRFSRHGDLRAGARFLGGQARTAIRLARGRSADVGEEARLLRVRLSGFLHGLALPGRSGFVGPQEFEQLRSYVQSARRAAEE